MPAGAGDFCMKGMEMDINSENAIRIGRDTKCIDLATEYSLAETLSQAMFGKPHQVYSLAFDRALAPHVAAMHDASDGTTSIDGIHPLTDFVVKQDGGDLVFVPTGRVYEDDDAQRNDAYVLYLPDYDSTAAVFGKMFRAAGWTVENDPFEKGTPKNAELDEASDGSKEDAEVDARNSRYADDFSLPGTLSYGELRSLLAKMRDADADAARINGIVRNGALSECGDFCDAYSLTTLFSSDVIRLLERMFSCEGDVSYFAYDLDYGRDWTPGSVCEGDKEIKLASIADMCDHMFDCATARFVVDGNGGGRECQADPVDRGDWI